MSGQSDDKSRRNSRPDLEGVVHSEAGNGSRAGKHPEKEQTERQNLRLARMQEVGKGPGSSTAQGQGKEEERGSCDPGLSVQRESIGCQGCRSGDSMPLRADRWELIGS